MKRLLLLLLAICIAGCIPERNGTGTQTPPENTAKLLFSLELNKEIYQDTDYGEPPQFAIWLENADSNEIKTVWVTRRVGRGDWAGKVECPVALPYWVGRYKIQAQTDKAPTWKNPLPDAITGATPTQSFAVTAEVPQGSRWKYFIEVNASGDYNPDFPSLDPFGIPDPQGNGQPSLIYKGEITAVAGSQNTPQLIGRTDQWEAIEHIIDDLEGITTAKQLFSKMEVTYKCSD